MAAGDIKIKLLLDGREFEATLQKAKGKSKDFKKSTEADSESISKAFSGVIAKGAAIGAAIGTAVGIAEKTFGTLTSLSQEYADVWGKTITTLETSWDALWATIANPSGLTAFSDGLFEAIERAEELYDAMQKLQFVKIGTDFSIAIDTSAIKEQMTIARDKTKSETERQSAIDEARKIVKTIGDNTKVLSEASSEAARASLAKAAGIDKEMVTINDVERLLRQRITASEEDKERVKGRATEYQAIMEKEQSDGKAAFVNWLFGGGIDIPAIKEEYKEDLLQNAVFNTMTAEDYEALAATYSSYKSAIDAYNEKVQELDSVQGELTNSIAAAKKAKEAALRKAEEASRKAAKEQAELTALKAYVLNASLTPISEMPISGITTTLDVSAQPNAKGVAIQSLDIANPLDSLEGTPWEEAQIQQIEKMGEALANTDLVVGSLSGSFASLGNSIGGSAGNMLEFVGSTMECIQQLIPLIGYIQAETIVHNANATAAMKDAAAKTLSSYAGIPFAGVALGIAAVASLVAMMSSLPKFAEGGIVTSATMGIFGEAGPEAVMPLDRLEEFVNKGGRDVRVHGEIVGRGKDLVVVIDNYNKTRRVRNG
ncbi:MAG: hypothetical protein J6V47_05495 [Bacteroidaceae bacterium]|nr:hypothetical protein [Bacteroidaceae bacterium]